MGVGGGAVWLFRGVLVAINALVALEGERGGGQGEEEEEEEEEGGAQHWGEGS